MLPAVPGREVFDQRGSGAADIYTENGRFRRQETGEQPSYLSLTAGVAHKPSQ